MSRTARKENNASRRAEETITSVHRHRIVVETFSDFWISHQSQSAEFHYENNSI